MISLPTVEQNQQNKDIIDANGFSLSVNEMRLVLLWRSLRDCVLDVSVQNGKPVYARVSYPDLLARMSITTYPFTEQESWYIELARKIRFGKLVMKIEEGTPVAPMTASHQTWDLTKDVLDIEFEG